MARIMKQIRLYHGTSNETTPFAMYMTPSIEEARQFALGLNDLGEYNKESYIYEATVDVEELSTEEDFQAFDCLAYVNPELDGYSDVVYNPKCGWYIVKNPELRLIEHYKNEL